MIPAALIILAAALVTASDRLSSLLALDCGRVMGGELWRLLSGHLSHLTWRQYGVDASAFVLLTATYCGREGTLSTLLLLFFSSLCVSAAVIGFGLHPYYGGLSGLSCAMASALLVAMMRAHPARLSPPFLLLTLCAYLGLMGGMAGGVAVAHEAHSAGVAAGALWALLQKNRRPKTMAA